jgi:hypothetical protein
MKRYVKGMKAKKRRPISIVLFLPITSDKAPAGSLKKIPVTVDIPTANPIASGPAPRYSANSGSTGLLARAYDNLAKKPTEQRDANGERVFVISSLPSS